MSKYGYSFKLYETTDEVEAAVTTMKEKLDDSPTTWCVVKPMINPRTIAIYSGDVIAYDSGAALTDTQIKALNTSSTVYNVYSIHDGDNFTEVTEADVAIKVRAMRTSYAKWLLVDKYFDKSDGSTHNVTNEDMSGYV